MNWNPVAKQKYDLMISKMPTFHRSLAKEVVDKEAENKAKERGAAQVEEQDIVAAFYMDVPAAFFSMMVRLMDMVGMDHSQFDNKQS